MNKTYYICKFNSSSNYVFDHMKLFQDKLNQLRGTMNTSQTPILAWKINKYKHQLTSMNNNKTEYDTILKELVKIRQQYKDFENIYDTTIIASITGQRLLKLLIEDCDRIAHIYHKMVVCHSDNQHLTAFPQTESVILFLCKTLKLEQDKNIIQLNELYGITNETLYNNTYTLIKQLYDETLVSTTIKSKL